MSKQTAVAYLRAFERNTSGLEHLSFGPASKCEDCEYSFGVDGTELRAALESGELSDEGGFSWNDCDLCGSQLGGDRFIAHAYLDGKLLHLAGCADCLVYVSNGDLPEDD